MFSHFLTFIDPDPAARLATGDRETLRELILNIPGLSHAHLHCPVLVRDLYFDDGPPPLLTMQLYFGRLETLEEAASAEGALLSLTRASLSSLARAKVSQQVMWTRRYTTPCRAAAHSEQPQSCSFLTHYPGEPLEFNLWLSHYLQRHVPIMQSFPDIRAIEIHTRVDWVDALPWQRVAHFQRNRIVFDSPDALEHALHSPVREQMRSDRALFPPFRGGNVHHACATETVLGKAFRP